MSARPDGVRDKRVCVAQIGAAHGLKGEVRLFSFTQEPLAIASYGALESEDGARKFEIEDLRQAKDHFVAKLRGVSDRDAAELLRNVKLYVPRERLPEPDEAGSFYHSDLIGLAVVNTTGDEIGELIAIHNFGAGDVLEVKLNDGSTTMLPFNEAAVPDIDLVNGRIVVDPPADA